MFLFEIVVTLFSFLSVSHSKDENHDTDIHNTYVSPWSNIKKAVPKIINFDTKGDFTTKEVREGNILSLKKILEAFKNSSDIMNIVSFSSSNSKNTDLEKWKEEQVLKNITSFLDIVQNTGKPRRKIFKYCDKSHTLCRFLDCENIRKFCTLCEVSLNGASETKCQNYNTEFLFMQNQN